MQKKDNNSLPEATYALENYLDELLRESTEDRLLSQTVNLTAKKVLLPELDLAVDIEPELDPETSAEPEPEKISVAGQKQQEKKTKPGQGAAVYPASKESEQEATSPRNKADEYNFPIQCLMFRVGNAELSIPLTKLGSVVPWVQNMTQLPQAPDWFLGLLKYRDTNVRVVDSLKLLGIKKGSALDTPRHILVLAQGQWAISCDQLGEVISLQAGDIQWYGTVSKSLMLGTIKQSLAQLLDPDQIVKYLNQVESG